MLTIWLKMTMNNIIPTVYLADEEKLPNWQPISRVILESKSEASSFFSQVLNTDRYRVFVVSPPRCKIVTNFRDAVDFFEDK